MVEGRQNELGGLGDPVALIKINKGRQLLRLQKGKKGQYLEENKKGRVHDRGEGRNMSSSV